MSNSIKKSWTVSNVSTIRTYYNLSRKRIKLRLKKVLMHALQLYFIIVINTYNFDDFLPSAGGISENLAGQREIEGFALQNMEGYGGPLPALVPAALLPC